MDVDLKVAILKSGKRQWEIAQEAGISESKLSKYLHGHGHLCEIELHRVYAVLKIGTGKEAVATGVEGQ